MNTTESFLAKYGEQLKAKIAELGVKYVLHPEYQKQKAHSYSGCWTLRKYKSPIRPRRVK